MHLLGWKVGSRVAGIVLLMLLADCRGWSGSMGLEVEGPSPYVRCLAASPPSASTRRIGAITARLEGSQLELRGLRAPWTLAAFSGPGFAEPPARGELAALRAAQPQLLIVLGGIGDSRHTARATLASLASLSIPTLVLAGGRDTRERVAGALEELGRAADPIIDITTLESIRIGGDTMLPVAGAFEGKYSLTDDGCGYGEGDLEDRASELAAAGDTRRWLLAWEAPASTAPHAVAGTELGVDTGSHALAEFGQRVHAAGGLFAWPEVQVLRPSSGAGKRRVGVGESAADLQLVVPRLTGPAIERSDGSRVAPGFVLLRLEPQGLRLVSVHSTRALD